MIFSNNNQTYALFIEALANESILGTEDIQKIKDEFTNDPTNRGYTSMTPIERLRAFCNEYTIQITIPAVTEPIKEWPTDILYNILLQANTPTTFVTAPDVPVLIVLDEMRNDANPQISGLAKLIWLTINSQLKAINLENPKVLTGIQTLHQMGVISNDLFFFITTKILEPERQEDRWQKARTFVVLGPGYFPNIREVIEASN